MMSKKQLKFGYRKSNLAKYVILQVKFKLLLGKKEEIVLKIKDYLRKREMIKEMRLPNAGCIFKNPLKSTAGRLIDACKLKQKKIGGAMVSGVHANFILNYRNAKSADVLHLMELISKKVKAKFKVDLEPEIKIW